jgi:hypothetical protein
MIKILLMGKFKIKGKDKVEKQQKATSVFMKGKGVVLRRPYFL